MSVIFKNIYAVYEDASAAYAILDKIGGSFLIPFFLFYFYFELAVGIGYIYMVVKKRLALKRPVLLAVYAADPRTAESVREMAGTRHGYSRGIL